MAGGRPAFFESPEDLEKKISEYFESCKDKVIHGKDDEDEPEETIIPGDTVTITGLALYLGFESRQSFYDYEKHEQFSYIIKRARLRVECEYEKRLQSKTPTGSIFALKNMGWVDKQEVDQSTTIKDERIDTSNFTDEDLRILAELQRKGRTSET